MVANQKAIHEDESFANRGPSRSVQTRVTRGTLCCEPDGVDLGLAAGADGGDVGEGGGGEQTELVGGDERLGRRHRLTGPSSMGPGARGRAGGDP